MPLFICGLPIGNPDDVSPRVLKTLAGVDFIAAEDTRSAALFLRQQNIQKELISFYDHNETSRVPQLIELLNSGKTIALISEAGMPLISDPGYHLVKAARRENIPVDVIPGPTALITALAASGLPTDSFVFHGFLSAKSGTRRQELAGLERETRTVIFYEAPHRILDTLGDIAAVFPERQCFIGRELTKKYQEHLHGTAKEILQKLKTVKGEFVIVLAGNQKSSADLPPEIEKLAGELKKAGLSAVKVTEIISETFALPKNKIKKILF